MYTAYRFGDLVLPTAGVAHDNSVGRATGPTFATAGGGLFDADSNQARKGPRIMRAPFTLLEIRHGGLIQAPPTSISEQFRGLRAQIGKRAYLYRRWHMDERSERIAARLEDVSARYDPQFNTLLDVDLTFALLGDVWEGPLHIGPWVLNDGHLLDHALYLDEATNTWTLSGGSGTFTLTNDGNATVRNAVLTFAWSGTLTALSLLAASGTDHTAHLLWAGSLTGSLVFDMGARSIKSGIGVDQYSGLTTGVSHVIESWLELPPGSTEIGIGFTGPASLTVTATWVDGWQ